jgi:hypothetical protein
LNTYFILCTQTIHCHSISKISAELKQLKTVDAGLLGYDKDGHSMSIAILVSTYKSTRRYNPQQQRNLHRIENLKPMTTSGILTSKLNYT